jgi:septal ring factor EnvC (AmiA/AmiB activator)
MNHRENFFLHTAGTGGCKKERTVNMPIKSGFKSIGLLLIALAVIVLTFLFDGSCDVYAKEIGIITAENLNLRPQPGTHAPPITVLKKGSEVEILGRQNGWLRVRYLDQIGFIPQRNNFVHIISVDTSKTDPSSQGKSERKIQNYKKRAEELERQIEDAEEHVRDFTSKEVTILTNLNDIDYAIDRAGRRISTNKSGLFALEKKIATTRDAYKKLAKQFDANEAYASKRLVALYKINQMGTIQFLASAGSVYEMLHRKKYLEQVLTHDESTLEKLMKDRAQLKKILDRLNEQQVKKRSIETSIKKEIRNLSQKKANRSKVLSQIRSRKSLQLAALDSLKNTAAALEQTIDTLADDTDTQYQNLSIHSFAELKGLLKMPVEGRIVSLFGPHKDTQFNVTVFRSGIDIKAKKGAAILAVYAGKILYADWFKGYGNMIIIDHGESYYTVYAHLHELFKKKGDRVNTGEDIATVGDAGSMIGPVLHFEVRHHGKPLDPLKWIVKG